ncbi:mCG1029190 [Mus musculus]|nr:mCG1029190 [Mus musculus]
MKPYRVCSLLLPVPLHRWLCLSFPPGHQHDFQTAVTLTLEPN